MRQTRTLRATRIGCRPRLLVEDVRRWCGLDQKEAVEQTEPVKQTEKISPDLKQTPERTTRRSLRDKQVRQSIEDYHKRQQQQRRSGGIRV